MMQHIIYKDSQDQVRTFSNTKKEVEKFCDILDPDQILYRDGVVNEVNTTGIKDWEVILKHFTKQWSTSSKLI